jgi:hypothetical protein
LVEVVILRRVDIDFDASPVVDIDISTAPVCAFISRVPLYEGGARLSFGGSIIAGFFCCELSSSAVLRL